MAKWCAMQYHVPITSIKVFIYFFLLSDWLLTEVTCHCMTLPCWLTAEASNCSSYHWMLSIPMNLGNLWAIGASRWPWMPFAMSISVRQWTITSCTGCRVCFRIRVVQLFYQIPCKCASQWPNAFFMGLFCFSCPSSTLYLSFIGENQSQVSCTFSMVNPPGTLWCAENALSMEMVKCKKVLLSSTLWLHEVNPSTSKPRDQNF